MSLKQNPLSFLDWRNWHHHVKYILIWPVWLWYIIRSGNVWFFTATDPSLTFGGFEGEGKKEMYLQLPEGSYPKTIYAQSTEPIEELEKTIFQAGYAYPFIVKPNIGMMGFMFRKISNRKQLEAYQLAMDQEYVIQELVEYPLEVSVFYYRMPGIKRGKISGFISKEPPSITGNGTKTIETLINEHPNQNVPKEKILIKFKERLEEVLPMNLSLKLSDASNRKQGGEFHDLSHKIDDKLLALFDKISLHSGLLFYGRYDILCNNVEDLKSERNFSILEFNGTGAGPQHYMLAPNIIVVEKIILEHWRMMYLIAKENRKLGVKPWGFVAGLKHLKSSKENLMKLLRLDADFQAT